MMDWSQIEISRERPLLEVFARLKYDEYQQFSPGMRFTESLAFWLSQFRESWERRCAYNFFKSKLDLLFSRGDESPGFACLTTR